MIADLDLDELVGKRAIHDYAGHYNRPDVLGLVIHQSLQPTCRPAGFPDHLRMNHTPRTKRHPERWMVTK